MANDDVVTTGDAMEQGQATRRLGARPAAAQAWLEQRSMGRHVGLAAASFLVLGAVNATLNRLYDASGFPVPYAEGQTSFDADAVKGWYATMSDAGTLDTYVATQAFDYVFMAMLATTGFLVASVVVRIAGSGLLARLGRGARTLVPLGAAADAVENLISFPMLARPETFADWLAIAHSSAATVKFSLIGIGLILLVVAIAGLLAGVLGRAMSGPGAA